MFTHIQVNDKAICSAALQQCHLPMFSLTYILALCYYWQAWQLKKQPRCSKCKRIPVRSWRAPRQQHINNHQGPVTLTLVHVFCQEGAAAQLSKSSGVSLSWPLGANTYRETLSLPGRSYARNSAPCLHIRTKLYNIDKNRQWKLWNCAIL